MKTGLEKIKFVTALQLNKRFKQSKEPSSPHTCAPTSELQSNISTMPQRMISRSFLKLLKHSKYYYKVLQNNCLLINDVYVQVEI